MDIRVYLDISIPSINSTSLDNKSRFAIVRRNQIRERELFNVVNSRTNLEASAVGRLEIAFLLGSVLAVIGKELDPTRSRGEVFKCSHRTLLDAKINSYAPAWTVCNLGKSWERAHHAHLWKLTLYNKNWRNTRLARVNLRPFLWQIHLGTNVINLARTLVHAELE